MPSPLDKVRLRLNSPLVWTAGALILIVATYIWNVESWKPETFFGRYSDDALYFSTAQALAQLHEYILPSFPGTPLKPQVPILYPLMLSGIWRLSPQLPENLSWAIRLTEGFGCLLLLCTFLLLRRLAGLARMPALVLTGVCAFHPFLLRLSGLTMTDVPFAAVFLLAVLLANLALSPEVSLGPAVGLGFVAALSASLRTLGYMLILGLFVYLLHRREYRRAVVYSLAVGLTLAFFLLLTVHYSPPSPATPISTAGGATQWQRLVVFHTEYVRFQWRMGIPTVAAFFPMLKENILQLVGSPGPFLAGAFDRRTWLLTAGLSAIVLSGTVRQLKRPEWRPFTFTAVPYIVIVIMWPFPIMERFLLPFLPVFLVAAVLESKRLLSLVKVNMEPKTPWANRILAVGLCGILFCYTAFAAWTFYFHNPRELREAADAQTKSLAQKREAYSWIRGHTAPDARIVAYDDLLLYLYSGRQALRPMAILPPPAYFKSARSDALTLEQDLAHMCDAPREAGAAYWLVTQDDFLLEAEREKIAAREAEIAGALPLVFRSSGNYARLYDTSCLLNSTRADCQNARAVLFPAGP